ncbi:GNAT family N-acetyltransferase [Pseudomonas sp. PSKL.D1]|uniref:GNAT family N-acetyltransferase n=1 Tax=Pseudomonas sp. PSKL.D1 TaxID=3029060 RepID=UPI0023813C89|nr:GNAT family N-acetyltransferase [Pseudomonas sp. PSKL.D1]WDY56809.1 GNAT family N-acetyltransferase [Pseudomonas sp. PSKL.D1]
MPVSAPSSYDYRPMTADDVANAHALSQALKWPHRLEDWAMLQRTTQSFVAMDNGQVIGSAFACHQGAFSTIGLVIVSDAYQGKGIGRTLMELAVGCVPPRTAILNATLAGEPLYAKMGFKAFGTVEQRQGAALPSELLPANTGDHYRDLGRADSPSLVALATAGSGLDRAALLDDLLPAIERGVGIEQDGQLQGFALLRRFGRGLCIGPVIAQDSAQAQRLIATLLNGVPGEFVRIDIPTTSGLSAWLEKVGLAKVDSVTQMSLGPIPQATGGVSQFALITQALG